MTELEVPQASRDAVRDTDKYAHNVDPQVLAIATPVVVAELRRLLHDSDRPGTYAEALRDRLLELEAGDTR